MKPIDIALIQARRKQIDAAVEAENARWQRELESHHARIAALGAEQNELEIAERVFARLSGTSDLSPKSTGEDAGKPADLPSVPDMIRDVLAFASERGRSNGLRPAELVAVIRARWWPDCPATAVGPIAWRMWKRGALRKVRGLYVLPPPEEETAEEPEVPDDDVDLSAELAEEDGGEERAA
jgi:hypothetical protein